MDRHTNRPATRPAAWPSPYLLAALAVLATAAYLLAAGRGLLAPSGTVRLWIGDRADAEGSQHLLDWYTPSHVIHGLLFYWLLRLLLPRLAVGWRFLLATLVECAWEVVENSDAVIERYRTLTVATDYNGDSIVNVLSDLAAMGVGFWVSRTLPVWATVALVLGFEVLALLAVRDGLTLNVLMLLWPVDAVKAWQEAG